MSNSNTNNSTIKRNVIITSIVVFLILIIGIILFVVSRPSDTETYSEIKVDLQNYIANGQDRLNEKSQLDSKERYEFTANEEYQPIIDIHNRLDSVDCEKVKQNETECFDLKNNLSILHDSFIVYVEIVYSYTPEELSNEDISEEDEKNLRAVLSNTSEIEKASNKINDIID